MLERNDMILREDRAHGPIAPYAPPGGALGPAFQQEESEPSLVASVLRHAWIVALVLALSLGAACVYLNRATPLYTSTSKIYIEQTGFIGPEGTAAADHGNYLQNQCELIKSTQVLKALIEMPEVKSLKTFSQVNDPLMYLRHNVDAEVGRMNDIISISVSTPQPEESAVLVNALVEQYTQYRRELAEKNTSVNLKPLLAQRDAHQAELDATKKQIAEFKKANPEVQLVSPSGDSIYQQRMINSATQLGTIQNQLLLEKQTLGEQNKRILTLKAMAEQYDTDYREALKAFRSVNDKYAELQTMQQHAVELAGLIEPLSKRITELQIKDDVRTNIPNVTMLEAGRVADTPSKPQKVQTLALASVIGLVLGSMLALLRDRTDNRLRTIEEVQGIVGLPILGVVPRMPGRRTAVARAMAVHLDPRSEVAEAYRTVRTAVYFGGAGNGNRAKTLLVTSPEPGDGKTTSASNLAIAIAQTGRNILLLDADFRKPTQHKNLDVKDTVGLSSVLAGIETLDRAIQRTGVDGLDILPCGPIPENPSEILNSQEFGELIDRLALKYDHILFDSPPANLVTDARILGAVCDASILVLRAEKSTRKAAEHARNALLSVGANLLGVIVNDVPRGKGYEVYGGQYYGTPEMHGRGSADYGSSSGSKPGKIARLPKPATEVSEQ